MSEAEQRTSSFPVKVDFERIMETISARIYDNQYAFLRENVQNAIDAIRIQASRERLSTDNSRYRIDVTIQGKQCTIQDNGIGMTKEELENNFWTMGASGKTTPEARAAGCIGVFGIGGFANFGVCDTLEVISRSEGCVTTHHTSLSKSKFAAQRFELPKVSYSETQELQSRGTIVRGTSITPFDVGGLTNYLKEFVKHVREAVYVQGKLLSQVDAEGFKSNYRELTDVVRNAGHGIAIQYQLYADEGHNLAATLSDLQIGGQSVACKGYLRLVHGVVDVFKRGFRICNLNISSRIGVSGTVDCDVLQPTAGRDTLDSKSVTLLTQIAGIVETAALPILINDADLLENHIRLLPVIIAQGLLEKIGLLSARTVDNRETSLARIREQADGGTRVFYTSSGRPTPAAEVMLARGHIIVSLSSNQQRRSAEVDYLRRFCKAEQFDNLIECLEPYSELNAFDRAVLSELDYAIRKLFKPSGYRFLPGRLTLDVPIYWSGKKEGDHTIVYIDTRHGEFQKLKPLGFTPLFWSMIEAFCIEYLGDTLKQQSPKFFGSGAIDLDAYSKAHAELWELLSSDIEISRIKLSETTPAARQNISRIEVVHVSDVASVTISESAGVKTAEATGPTHKPPPKLLHIIDETGATGLHGYYLRIPESATVAFGELIRTFSSFVLVWFANRITWHASDLTSTSFLFDITLDRLITNSDKGSLAHGARELGPTKIHTYNGQIYFYIAPDVEEHIVPKDDSKPLKIEIRHELLDLGKPRSWTSRTHDT